MPMQAQPIIAWVASSLVIRHTDMHIHACFSSASLPSGRLVSSSSVHYADEEGVGVGDCLASQFFLMGEKNILAMALCTV